MQILGSLIFKLSVKDKKKLIQHLLKVDSSIELPSVSPITDQLISEAELDVAWLSWVRQMYPRVGWPRPV